MKFVVSQILYVIMWKSQSLFTKFYRRDVTHRSLDTFPIGFVVMVIQQAM